MEISFLETAKTIIHWLSLGLFVWIFGYAGLYKIMGIESMMSGMEEIGFGKEATLWIGVAEVLGVLGILAGLYIHPVKIASVLLLWPFAIGALTVHLSYHHPISVYLNSLLVTVLPVIILWTEKKFSITLS